MAQESDFLIDLRQMVVAIENAVSLVGINDTNHGKRVGYIALQIAEHLGFSQEEKHFVFELGLLHDCGVSSDMTHKNLVMQFEWEDIHEHCRAGYDLVKDFTPLADLARPILHHHTHWSELKDLDLSDRDKYMANLIFLADRIDVGAAGRYGRDILLYKDELIQMVRGKSETLFHPQLVEGFLSVSSPEAFWITLEDRHIQRFAWDLGHIGHSKKISLADLKQLARIFSTIVDKKSAFTARHSLKVGQLSRYLAKLCALPEQTIDKVEIAAYLHDIGKLHVPDAILEKPGPLNAMERAVINQHSYETYEILRPIKGLEEIAKWAAFHHENETGTGYPFHLSGEELSMEARIIATADVFQALVEDRPYRDGMTPRAVATILNDMAGKQKLDAGLVNRVMDHMDDFYALAKAG